MKKLIELKEQRASKTDALRAIVNKATTEKRDLTDDEQTAFDAGRTDVERIEREIRNAEFLAEAERRTEADPVSSGGGEFDRELRNYSLADAIMGAMNGRLTGREAEIDEELKRGREGRSGAQGIHLAVPSEILLGRAEHRNQTVGTAAAGGVTVATNLAALGDRFRPALKVESMGATVLRGLTGFLDLPNLAGSGSVSWVAENGNATRTAATFEKVSMAPKTVAGEYRMSRRLILQSSAAIEDVLRRDLGFLLAQELDRAAIAGTGTAPEPRGVLHTAGVEQVPVVGTAGSFVGSSDITSDLMAALEVDDVTGTGAFLTHPRVMNQARKLKDTTGRNIPIAEVFHNARVESSTQVPTNLGDDDNRFGLIYGQWGELYIGYWSAVDILINPYHPDVASNGGALLHAFLDADVAIRHPKAFAYAEI